jgi:endonuclease III related protein
MVGALGERYGPLPWWQAPPEEMMIGAVLVQQTRWENVERALDRLRGAGLLSLDAIDRAPAEAVEKAVRCAGFFRVKTRRLKALARFVIGTYGSVGAMARASTDVLRRDLLAVYGIGEETADAILCYAFGRCSFVIDAYTRRLCACAGVAEPPGGYRALFEAVLPPENERYRQTHAHIVEHGKNFCSKRRCEGCSIRSSDE